MILATIGDILAIRKQYQATFKYNSDEPTSEGALTGFDFNKFKELCLSMEEEPITGIMLAEFLEESLVTIPMESGDNFIKEINDPTGGGSIMGYSGKDKYDLMNIYEPETLDDTRQYPNSIINIPKSKQKNKNTIYNQTKVTTTGRIARV